MINFKKEEKVFMALPQEKNLLFLLMI